MFALYVHWPFCAAKCPYCDFNSHVRAGVDHARWRRALLADLAAARDFTGPRRLGSIFFGGGTPSLMEPGTAAAVIGRALALWPPEAGAEPEITLEANPTSAEAARFRAFADAGVNRLSVGVQALDNSALAALGRHHTAREAVAAVEAAVAIFPRHSLDLIYARPGQTAAAWRRELEDALRLAGDHMSLYQLTIEPGTDFHRRARLGRLHAPGADAAAALYAATAEIMARHGLPAYEISNHARPGGESRHNLAYWTGADYAGIGPGAHGRVTRAETGGPRTWATTRPRAPEAWLRAVEEEAPLTGEALPPRARLEEVIMTGLRLTGGVPVGTLAAIDPAGWAALRDGAAMRTLLDAGFVTLADGGAIAATPAGRCRLNAVLGHLLG